MSFKLFCDVCSEEIPMVKKTIDDIEIDVYELGKLKTREWDFDSLFHQSHICKKCAKKLRLKLCYNIEAFRRSINESTSGN